MTRWRTRPDGSTWGDFGPDDIPWDQLAFSTAESALRDWIASLPGHGPRFEPELYVSADPD